MLRPSLPHLVASLALVTISAACSAGGDAPATPDEPCAGVAIDRFKELAIVDDAVTSDPRVSNAARGAWSFAYLVEQMAPEGTSPSAFVHDWLETWNRGLSVNSFRVDARPLVVPKLVCPWLRATPANGCNDTCSVCTGTELDLAKAPFRLLGLANRTDLRETEDFGGAGEGRLVFGLTNGPADDPASVPLNATFIFEFKLPTANGETAKTWAERFHALGRHAAFDEAYKSELQAVTDAFTRRGANPAGINGSAINQVRINEREFEWQWDLREYKLAPGGRLAVAATRNTPDASMLASPALGDWLLANRETVMKRQHETPPNLTGGQSQPIFPLRPARVDEELRKVFAEETCAGCHQLEHVPVDINFHYSPFQRGTAKLSPFLHEPGAVDRVDELTRREGAMRRGLCGS